MKNHKILVLSFVLFASTQIFSCSKESDTAKLQEAQLCLNSAAASEALSCVSKIESDTSPLAYSLRCSAIFISQGFGDAVDFIDALNSINDTAACTSCSSTVNALNALKFTAAGITTPTQLAANNQAAANAFTQCSRADAKIYTQIASLFRIGTLASMAAYNTSGGASYTQDDLVTALTTLTPTDIGAIVSVTFANACQNLEDASESTVTYCNELQTAVNSGATEADIGNCLINKLANSAYVCP